MNILEKIIAQKHKEVEQKKKDKSSRDLERSVYFQQPPISLKKNLKNPSKAGIIAEFKRRSPSKGDINPAADPVAVAKGYEEAGAAGISVLTDEDFFGGSNHDMTEVRQNTGLPLLRKDFIIDEYQILEARSIGANVILLIAAALETERIRQLSSFCKSLQMEVLLEVHNEEELLPNLFDTIDIVGVNNRNLKTFDVDVQTSIKLAEMIPDKYLKISESGIADPDTIALLHRHGFNGYLIGETFMKEADPVAAIKDFVGKMKEKGLPDSEV